MPEAHVFVSYVREDRERVDHLANALRVAGVEVWVDRDALEPGVGRLVMVPFFWRVFPRLMSPGTRPI
jgi:hypothetical protein